MKREIKFRAWVANRKMVTDFHSIELFHNGKHHVNTTTISHYDEKSILMQYTGLKDKNGVEIYESDILENPQGRKGIVKFEDGGFIIESKRDETTIWTTKIDKGFLKNKKVIGNIHENPELL